jgi:hypothetical protein
MVLPPIFYVFLDFSWFKIGVYICYFYMGHPYFYSPDECRAVGL